MGKGHEAMGKACADHEEHFTIAKWIVAMLSNCMVRLKIKGVSSTMMVRRGWSAFSLLVRLNNKSLWVQGFVNDISIVNNGKFLSTVCELMQKALFIVQTCCREVKLSVNADKTSMVLFTNNRKLVGFKKPILFGTEL
jgi:hypothetical protein